jgi:hypothetical protein
MGTEVCYRWAMKPMSFALLFALAAVIGATTQSPAATTSLAGFPMYPHASIISPGSASVPGFVLQSHDSVATIDRWYRSKLPKTCRRQVLQSPGKTAIEYMCSVPRALVDIVPDKGKVDIHAQPI